MRYRISRPHAPAGKRAGSPDANGYLIVNVDGQLYKLHRLIWLWMTGKIPPDEIDHRNRDVLDNRFTNLRCATRSENNHNRSKNKNNRSGFKGVSYSAMIKNRPWRATISANGKFVHLGRFATKAEASRAYNSAAHRMHGEFARR
jgi:hypothetical protein